MSAGDEGANLRWVVDIRFICEDCRIKWFVPSGRPVGDDLKDCAACGGRLIPLHLDLETEYGRPGDADADS